ncbi:hypothetical protein HBI56_082590 [Parastagonospora nodorum]|uniref:Uncharacterized protein n=1 Tax=Phaeosphaeria nodorum (strain SN15 / ATCC MYA-4574 / FGSC 10173) TaxID=321614 RepID=A0A7U2FG72_PHANO|nr:hypothetical protein HBH56_103980 [Parastagonospora nodorum]QRD04652.1 hypothetical protein JI435_105870 [Parastagonospora nodorum SN15]KAH3929233.1 hypothetical protein HBH54_126430 [Parastagonospora nodorum]KAH3951648.1 hypothetical protein HBH53_060430 [Parastagonospora nodorum]KAH3975620.1 hypothetical protein HBH52_126420 [Parastagonospora nodorum]
MAGNLLTLGRLGAVHVVTAAQMMVVQGRPGMEIDCCGPSRQQKDGNRPSTDLAPSRRSSASAFTGVCHVQATDQSVEYSEVLAHVECLQYFVMQSAPPNPWSAKQRTDLFLA